MSHFLQRQKTDTEKRQSNLDCTNSQVNPKTCNSPILAINRPIDDSEQVIDLVDPENLVCESFESNQVKPLILKFAKNSSILRNQSSLNSAARSGIQESSRLDSAKLQSGQLEMRAMAEHFGRLVNQKRIEMEQPKALRNLRMTLSSAKLSNFDDGSQSKNVSSTSFLKRPGTSAAVD